MNIKKALAIGLLTTAIIGLGACAIAFNQKQKTTKTNAEYWFENITATNTNITNYRIDGITHNDEETESIWYQIQVNQGQTTITTSARKILGINVSTLPEEIIVPVNIQNVAYIKIERIYSRYTLNTLTSKYRFTIQDEDEVNVINTDVTYTTIQPNQGSTIDNTTYIVERIDPTTNFAAIEQYGTHMYQTGATTNLDYGTDIVDVRGMMYTILTMPFTFINQAFDVTLWAGTQYAFNVGNFIKSIIAIGAILFIIKLFTSGFAVLGNYTGTTEKPNTRSQKIKTKYEKGHKNYINKIEKDSGYDLPSRGS